MNQKSFALATALTLAFSLPASADILEFKSGEIIKGIYAGGSQNSIRFNINGEMEVILVNKIMALTFTGSDNSASSAKPAAVQPAAVQPAAVQAAPAAPQPVFADENIEIAAGTPFMIRTRSVLDSGKLGQGNKFTAVLEGNLMAGNKVVAKQGDTVYGQVVSVKKAGRLVGTAHLSIELTALRIDGNIVQIATNTLNLTTDSSTGKSAGTTVKAAAIGGLADGSDGAKTGAKIGLGLSMLTPGNQVVVPSGTLLDFRFRAPLKV